MVMPLSLLPLDSKSTLQCTPTSIKIAIESNYHPFDASYRDHRKCRLKKLSYPATRRPHHAIMKRSQYLLIAVILACLTLLSTALYLQLVKNMMPCPLCMAQRYAFIGIALACLVALITPPVLKRWLLAAGMACGIYGMVIAIQHVHLLANPELSCGVDPLETFFNKVFLARWWPTMFHVDGFCETPYPPFFGLSIPAWALIWFMMMIVAIGAACFQKAPRGMFGKQR